MREIHRTIASALIFSKDNKLLMWRKDSNSWWVYLDCWHIPWGWIDEWESLEEALIREVKEEIGLDISNLEITLLSYIDTWISEKTLKNTWEKVLCHMEFNRFKVFVNKNASDIVLHLTDDLVEIKWFNLEELSNIKHIPWGKKFFQKIWYIKQKNCE